jgi:membrane-associated protein
MEPIHSFLAWLRDLGPWLGKLAATNLPLSYTLIFAIVFAETGLVVTPFLPGDSLLFFLGTLAAPPEPRFGFATLFVLVSIAAVLGDAVNYAIGYRLGPAVFRSEGSWFFNKKHLLRAQAFYEKYGSKTIILARFVPIVRTFAPFVAGIGKMEYRRFAFYNVLGAVLWVGLCLTAGYYFGGIDWVQEHFEMVMVAIVAISVLPMVIEFGLHVFRKKESAPAEPLAEPTEAA